MSVANAYKDHVKNLKVSEQLLTKSIAKKTRQRRLKGKLCFTAKIDPQDEVGLYSYTLTRLLFDDIETSGYKTENMDTNNRFFFALFVRLKKRFRLYFLSAHNIPPPFFFF
jgi:hypothetical protein